MIKIAYIGKLPSGEYRVYSKKGKNLGTYKTYSEAKKRLSQVEMFKHMKKDAMSTTNEKLFKMAKVFEKLAVTKLAHMNPEISPSEWKTIQDNKSWDQYYGNRSEWHVGTQYGEFAYDSSPDVWEDGRPKNLGSAKTGWHKHPFGTYYAEEVTNMDEIENAQQH